MRRVSFIVVISIISFLSAASLFAESKRPNFLIILTDDQRYDTVGEFMPFTQKRIFDEGVSFDRFYLTIGACCPSRASIMTGLKGANHGVLFNTRVLFERTMFEYLRNEGYYNGIVGKYLNSWDGTPRAEFDFWAVFSNGGASFNNPVINVNGTWDMRKGYVTDVLRDYALQFLDDASRQSKPFILLFAVNAPHEPSEPAVEDANLYSDLKPHRPPSFDEEDLSDKPQWLSRFGPMEGNADHGKTCGQLSPDKSTQIEELDYVRCKQLRALRSVDRAVNDLLDELKKKNVLDDTVVFFLSDNGYYWGEHKLEQKNRPYEEANRLPFAVRYPPLTGSGAKIEHRLAGNIDIMPTILELAGVKNVPYMDGESLVPILKGSRAWRDDFIMEGYFGRPYSGIRTPRYVYIETRNDKPELYDLQEDPFQLENKFGSQKYLAIQKDLIARLGRAKERNNLPLWVTTFTGEAQERAESVQRTPDNAYITAGTIGDDGRKAGWIAKSDLEGNLLWQKQVLHESAGVALHSVVATIGNTYTVAGETGNDVLVASVDENGKLLWQKQLGGTGQDTANALLATPDEGYILAGATESFGLKDTAGWIVKLDNLGNMEWQRAIQVEGAREVLKSIARDWGFYEKRKKIFDGGYVAVGSIHDGKQSDLWLVRITVEGDLLWQKKIGGTADDEGSMVLTVDLSPKAGERRYFIVGSTESFGAGRKDVWTINLEGTGKIQSQNTFGGPHDEEGQAAFSTSWDTYVVAANSYSIEQNQKDILLLDIFQDRNLRWQKWFGGTSNDAVYGLERAANGGMIVAGSTRSFSKGSEDVWLFRLDDMGLCGANCSISTPGKFSQGKTSAAFSVTNARSIVIKEQAVDANVAVTSASLEPSRQFGSFILKCDPKYVVSTNRSGSSVCAVKSIGNFSGPIAMDCPDQSQVSCKFTPDRFNLKIGETIETALQVSVSDDRPVRNLSFSIRASGKNFERSTAAGMVVESETGGEPQQ